MATAKDYRWFDKKFESLAVAYCFSYLRGISADEALTRFGVGSRRRALSLDDLEERALEVADGSDWAFTYLGALELDGWTLLVEPNGFLGVSEVGEEASRGTEMIAHFVNVNAVSRFVWIQDGDVRVVFEMMFPQDREGSEPDALVDLMRAAGFDPNRSDDDETPDDLCFEAGFALAANLTGVELTAKLLRKSLFLCGRAPVR